MRSMTSLEVRENSAARSSKSTTLRSSMYSMNCCSLFSYSRSSSYLSPASSTVNMSFHLLYSSFSLFSSSSFFFLSSSFLASALSLLFSSSSSSLASCCALLCSRASLSYFMASCILYFSCFFWSFCISFLDNLRSGSIMSSASSNSLGYC
jgi:hypothetical protein